MDDVLFSNFSAQQSHYLKINLCLSRCPHPHFIRHQCLCVTIVRHQLAEPRTLEQSDRKGLLLTTRRRALIVRRSLTHAYEQAKEALRICQICSVPSSKNARFALFRNWDSLGAGICHSTLTYIMSITSYTAGTTAAAVHSKNLFTGRSREIYFALRAKVSNIATQIIRRLQLMSGVLIIINSEIKKRNWKRNDKCTRK